MAPAAPAGCGAAVRSPSLSEGYSPIDDESPQDSLRVTSIPALSTFQLDELYEEIRQRAVGTVILQFFPQRHQDEDGYLLQAATDLTSESAPRVFHHVKELFRGVPPDRSQFRPPSR